MKSFTLFIVLLLLNVKADSQTPFNNHGDTLPFSYTPISYSHDYDYARIRIHHCGFNSADVSIDSISFFIDAIGSAYDTVDVVYRIYMFEDTVFNSQTNVANLISGATLVFDDTIPLNSGMDSTWLHIPFSNPYIYSGGSLNIVFESVNTNHIKVDSNEITIRHNWWNGSAAPMYGLYYQLWKSDSVIPSDYGTVIYGNRPNFKLAMHNYDSCNFDACYLPQLSYFPDRPTLLDSITIGLDLPPLEIGFTYNWQISNSMTGGTWINLGSTTESWIKFVSLDYYSLIKCFISCNGVTVYTGSNPLVVSIDEKNQADSKNLLLFPNPAHDFVKVFFIDKNNTEFQLYSADGSIVKSGKIKSGDQLYIDSFKSGIYFLNVYSENTNCWKKLIIN